MENKFKRKEKHKDKQKKKTTQHKKTEKWVWGTKKRNTNIRGKRRDTRK